ncbi:Acylphosphatase [Capsicum chinense]|nr:Acylphosphatase [Capsicum chinense]
MSLPSSSFLANSLFISHKHFIRKSQTCQQCQTRILLSKFTQNVVIDKHRGSTKPISFQFPFLLLPLCIGWSSSLSFSSCFALSCSPFHILHRFQSPPLSSPMSSLSSEQNSGHDAKTVRAVIKGRVQGVFYRDWTVENAKELGLKGWVRNRRDGTVEALFSGSPEKVQEMEQRCRRGPPSAIVTGLDVFPCDDDPGTGFKRKQTA